MCVFSSTPIKKVHQLGPQEALIGYKYLNVSGFLGRTPSASVLLKSPIQDDTWTDLKLKSRKPTRGGNSGIYAYRTPKIPKDSCASTGRFVLVEVALWGTVYEHEPVGWDKRPILDKAGFRAQYAEVVVIELATRQKGLARHLKASFKNTGVLLFESYTAKEGVFL